MNLLLQLLTAALLIAVMIGVRMFADRRVLRHRLARSLGSPAAGGESCSHGCSKHDSDAGAESGCTDLNMKRRARHAP